MRYFFLTIFLSTLIVRASAECKPGPMSAVWIDVRTSKEYIGRHLEGAHNIEFEDIGSRILTLGIDRSAPIFLYCQSGRRSGIAKQTLDRLGYTNVVNAGGISHVMRTADSTPKSVACAEMD